MSSATAAKCLEKRHAGIHRESSVGTAAGNDELFFHLTEGQGIPSEVSSSSSKCISEQINIEYHRMKHIEKSQLQKPIRDFTLAKPSAMDGGTQKVSSSMD